MNRVSFRPTHSFRQQVCGATIMEVIVSVFLLTFGVLGLMAAQIRSVASIGEAESRSTVSQAAETLSEGMLANPNVTLVNERAVRRYPQYTKSNAAQTVDMNANNTLPNPIWGGSWNSTATATRPNISKQDLANQQIAMFEYLLRQTPNAETIQYVICEENSYPPKQAELDASGRLKTNCSAGAFGNNTVIKVVWTTRPAKQGETGNAYSYLLQVQE
ncbi:MAG: type IV pilus modification protein PilV [Conchiformibius sp.]|nr:type IV pilus modification protein PilV [Conchiformibius sp.]